MGELQKYVASLFGPCERVEHGECGAFYLMREFLNRALTRDQTSWGT